MWTGSDYGQVSGHSDQENEPLGFVKSWEFLHHTSDFQLPKRESAPGS
jgi:hypothetical protein